MRQIDWQQEKERLAKLYSGMADSELEKIGSDPKALTDVAREVLQAEMSRRGFPFTASAPEAPHVPPAPSGSPLVLVRRYRDLPEAAVGQSMLDSAGIDSFLADENLVRLDWFYSNLVGGIKLLVREEDAEAASGILTQQTPEQIEVEGVGTYEQPKCPECGSLDVTWEGLDRPVAYGSLFFGVPIPATLRGWLCQSCRHSWDTSDEAPEVK